MMKKPSGLGRGLGALFGESAFLSDEEPESNRNGGVMTLPITDIENNSAQPRKNFDPEALAQLADSIRQHGILQPLTVRKMDSGYYQIIAGERRWRAARMAGLDEAPVIVVEADDKTATELAMIENLQREDLNPMEEAAGYRTLIDLYGMTQEEVSSRVGKSRSAVANALRLLDLSEPVRTLVEEGKLTAGHARALIPLPADLQEQAAKEVMDGGLSVRQTERLAKQRMEERRKPQSVLKRERLDDPNKIDYTIEAQKELSVKLGRGVRIVNGRKKGRIELDFYGLDDLNALLDALSLLRISQTWESVETPEPSRNEYGEAQQAQNEYGEAEASRNGYGEAEASRNGYGEAQQAQNEYGEAEPSRDGYGEPEQAHNEYGEPEQAREVYGE